MAAYSCSALRPADLFFTSITTAMGRSKKIIPGSTNPHSLFPLWLSNRKETGTSNKYK